MLAAVANVNSVLHRVLSGEDAADQAGVDRQMREAGGTPDKRNLGANAVLAVSRASAAAQGVALYRHLAQLSGWDLASNAVMPVPLMNVLNGGLHAPNALPFEEFMICPRGAPTFAESLRYGAEVFAHLRIILAARGFSTTAGEEGDFAPGGCTYEEALDCLCAAVRSAGYSYDQVSLALDCAANQLYADGEYQLDRNGPVHRNACGMGELYLELVDRFPIVSLEDAAAAQDLEGWLILTRMLGKKIQVVGDDLFATNPERLRKGILLGSANAVLIKPNQVGTLTETLEAIAVARAAGYQTIAFHRFAETEDAFIADLPVGTGCAQIKAGSVIRSERLAKYNRLLQIEQALGTAIPFGPPRRPWRRASHQKTMAQPGRDDADRNSRA